MAQLEALQGPWTLCLSSSSLNYLPTRSHGPLPSGPLPLAAAKSFPLQTATSIHLCLLAPQGLDRELLTLRRLKVQGQPSADKWVTVGGGCCCFLTSEEGACQEDVEVAALW